MTALQRMVPAIRVNGQDSWQRSALGKQGSPGELGFQTWRQDALFPWCTMALYFNCYLCMGTFEGKKYIWKGEEQYTECSALLCVKQRAGWLLFSLPLVLITAFWDVCYYFCYYYAYVIDKDKKCWELSNDCKATENSSLALSAPNSFFSSDLLPISIVSPGIGKHTCPAMFAEWLTEWTLRGISWLLPLSYGTCALCCHEFLVSWRLPTGSTGATKVSN